MSSSLNRTGYHMASRVQRLDRRRECRFMLALVMLMGVATASVLATTREALSDPSAIVTVMLPTR
ncbi:hypothetical protein [Microvirga antarctica]|uniref:hypothetical protein n=1 Tax=Microvirga antarctica TaxID=2819233 RepID=UPI001B315561|nr:hypothetical protein [Microvirga antarctica]